MRISGDAISLVRVAELLVLERDRLEGDLANVGMYPLPSMPPGLRAMVEGELQEAAADARAIAVEAEGRALELKKRAWFMFIAAGGMESIKLGKEIHGGFGHASDVVRELRFIRAYDDLEELAAGTVGKFGPTSLEATNAWFRWQTKLPESMLKSGAFKYVANEDWLAAREAMERPGRLVSLAAAHVGPETGSRLLTASKWFGRLSGPLMVGSSILTLTSHERYHGARGAIDRWGVGGAGFGAGFVLTGGLFLPFAPELVAGAAVVALGIAAWQVGNLIYDNRQPIKHGLAGASKWVWHHSAEGFVFDHRDDIKQGVVSASQWGHDKTEEAAKWAGDKVKNVGSTIEHGIAHEITHPFGLP